MKIKELIYELMKYDDEREVVLHYWDRKNNKSFFFPLMLSATPTTISENLLVLTYDKYCPIKPKRTTLEGDTNG